MANYNHLANGKFAPRTELSPLQLKFMGELMAGINITAACKKLDINRSTVYLWFDTEIWQNEYKKMSEYLYKETCHDAIKNLIDLMKCDDNRTKIKACEDILKLNNYLTPKVDVEQNTTQNIVISLDSDDNTEEQ